VYSPLTPTRATLQVSGCCREPLVSLLPPCIPACPQPARSRLPAVHTHVAEGSGWACLGIGGDCSSEGAICELRRSHSATVCSIFIAVLCARSAAALKRCNRMWLCPQLQWLCPQLLIVLANLPHHLPHYHFLQVQRQLLMWWSLLRHLPQVYAQLAHHIY
jgi:hypothetical protein